MHFFPSEETQYRSAPFVRQFLPEYFKREKAESGTGGIVVEDMPFNSGSPDEFESACRSVCTVCFEIADKSVRNIRGGPRRHFRGASDNQVASEHLDSLSTEPCVDGSIRSGGEFPLDVGDPDG